MVGWVIFLQAYKAYNTKNATVHLSNQCLFHWCHRYLNELLSSCPNTQGLYVIPRLLLWVRLSYPIMLLLLLLFLFRVSRKSSRMLGEVKEENKKQANPVFLLPKPDHQPHILEMEALRTGWSCRGQNGPSPSRISAPENYPSLTLWLHVHFLNHS